MASQTVINERLEYVRNHITDGQRELSEAMGVAEVTALRYRRHLRFGEPISGKYQAKKKVTTIPQHIKRLEGKVDKLTKMVGELEPRSKRGLFGR
jgi:3-methyladenine DNA glycosylase/8-oxoguanine DNA glycosylase